MTGQLASHHLTQGMDEVPTIKIVEPVLIWVMSVGTTVEIVGRRVLHSILVTSILGNIRTCVTMRIKDLHNTPPHCT